MKKDMQEAARKAANNLIQSAMKKKRWTTEQSKQWTRAFNALVKLSKV